MPTTVSRGSRPPGAGGDPTRILGMLDKSVNASIATLESSPEMFGMTFSSALTRTQAHCLADPAANAFETWEAWTSAMQVGSAMFAAATAPEGSSVQVRVAREMRTIPATGPQHFTNAGNWLQSFWLAITCREQGRMTELCQVPVSLLRESGAAFDEYIYDWVAASQAYWLEQPEMGDKLLAAFRGTDPEALQVADRELMLKILYPPLNMFLQFIKRDHDEFNKALLQALELHKEYWTASDERQGTTDGAVALGPLAIACLAYDVGFPIEVRSEYLPEVILERDWLGEFDT